ncbi:Helicase associated domain protein [Streptomyces monashensis]|uniref:Helicase-associated domain-containing protein n=1 Tax=Streptomyces monashensis TaxID=1678012 RepID=A0A1S2PF12_9ACTN|nr:Helicase associated domain protein [Streptomyces monashensis]OIJ92419.1 hypothetical protein BIV23_38570 [Streptomyces monashensis]
MGEGHPLQFLDVSALAKELGRAQRRWGRVSLAAGAAAGAEPGEVFALARAVVCSWWEREEFWERETAWGWRLEQVAAATRRRCADPAGWGAGQWRLLVRDAVTFPEVVAMAQALVDPRMRQLVAGDGAGALVRGRGGGERFAAALGERLGREWLGELQAQERTGPLVSWAQAVSREQRREAGLPPRQGRYGLWWVHTAHRPVEVGAGLRLMAEAVDAIARPGCGAGAGPEAVGRGKPPAAGGWQAQWAVPRRAGHGRGLEQRSARLFAEGLEQARRHAAKFGHLAVPHTDGQVTEGFDLGRWLANQRAEAASLTRQRAAQLQQLDPWWNPPWPVDWQRAWYRARAHVLAHGRVHGGDNLDALPHWFQRWLRHQITHYRQLQPRQQSLLAELGLTQGEVECFWAWPGRRRPAPDSLAVARAYAARHGHLAVSQPTVVDGFPLGRWLTHARLRQRAAGRPTRIGRELTALDPWWNPPWPIPWQQMWWTCRHRLSGLPHHLAWWPDAPNREYAIAWLSEQAARRPLLQPGQQDMVEELLALAGGVPQWQPRISDIAWQTLSPLLPPPTHTGGRPRSERQLLEAIIHIACTRQAWTRLPAALSPFEACRHRYLNWHSDGTLTRICQAVLPEQDTHWQQHLATYLRSPGMK